MYIFESIFLCSEYLSDNSDIHFDDNYPDTGPQFNLEFIFVDYEKSNF